MSITTFRNVKFSRVLSGIPSVILRQFLIATAYFGPLENSNKLTASIFLNGEKSFDFHKIFIFFFQIETKNSDGNMTSCNFELIRRHFRRFIVIDDFPGSREIVNFCSYWFLYTTCTMELLRKFNTHVTFMEQVFYFEKLRSFLIDNQLKNGVIISILFFKSIFVLRNFCVRCKSLSRWILCIKLNCAFLVKVKEPRNKQCMWLIVRT